MNIEQQTIIKEASLKLFKKIGFAKTSIADIAAESNITKALFYKNYHSKEDIFSAIIDDHFTIFIDKNKNDLFSNSVSFKQKIESISSEIFNIIIYTKDLTLGFLDNIDIYIIKNISNILDNFIPKAIVVIKNILNNYTDDFNCDEKIDDKICDYLGYLIGRIMFFITQDKKGDISILKDNLIENCYGIFKTIIFAGNNPQFAE